MTKASKKKAKDLTTNEAMDRVFGSGAAKRLRQEVARLDRQKPKKKPKKANEN
jgi:hypothetical protein